MRALIDAGVVSNRLGMRLKSLRTSNQMTQLETAKRIGVTQSILSRIERGEYAISAEIIASISMAFGIDPGELFASQIVTNPGSLTPTSSGLMKTIQALHEELEVIPDRLRSAFSETREPELIEMAVEAALAVLKPGALDEAMAYAESLEQDSQSDSKAFESKPKRSAK